MRAPTNAARALALPFAAVGAAHGWLFTQLFHMREAGAAPLTAAIAAASCALVGNAWRSHGVSPALRGASRALAGGLVGGASIAILLAPNPSVADRTVCGAVLGTTLALIVFLPVLALVRGAPPPVVRARPGSVADASDRRGIWFRAGCATTAAAWLVGLAPWVDRQGWMPVAAFGALGLVLVSVADLRALGLLFRAIRGAHRARDDEMSPEHAEVLDLGMGDERWIHGGARAHPYRSAGSVTRVLRGALFEVQALLTRAAFARAGVALVAALALLVSLSRRPSEPPAPVTTVAAPMPAETRAPRLAWYPQHGPILVELNGDGVEDVVGLRWDSGHEEAALSVVATDGANLRTLWSTAPLRSQWYSSKTHLVRSADRLYLTDSEGLLHIYDLQSGRELRDPIRLAHASDMCGAPGAPAEAWIRDNDDYRAYDSGVFVDGNGVTRPGVRPAWCHVGDRRSCDKPGDGPCASRWRPKAKRSLDPAYALEEKDVGVAFATERPDGARGGGSGWYLTGYDPKTEKVRWESAFAFDDSELHAQPHMQVELARGMMFGFYQLKTGKWVLGARDGATGTALWRREPPRVQHGTNFTSMTISPQRLYVVVDWRVEVFDPATGDSLGVIW